MNGTALALVAADLRREPARALATAALIAVAGLGAAAGTVPFAAGVALAAGITWAACAATSETRLRTVSILGGNGARRRTLWAVGLGGALVPGVLAVPVLFGGFALFGTTGSPFARALSLGLAVPGGVGLVAAMTARRVGEAPIGRRRRSTIVLWSIAALGLVLVAPYLVVVLVPAALAGIVTRRSWLLRLPIALLLVVAVGVLVGGTTDWTSLLLAILVGGPAAAVGIAMLGMLALDLAAALGRRASVRSNLATAGLARNRRMVMPLLAGLTVTCAALTVNGVIAASFGEREARRVAEIGHNQATAGTGGGQAIRVAVAPDPEHTASALRVAAGNPEIVVVAIDEVLSAPAATTDDSATLAGVLIFGGGAAPMRRSPNGIVTPGSNRVGPDWVGTADPDDLRRIGLGAAADDLAAGRAVLFNGTLPEGDMVLAGAQGPVVVDARRATGTRIATHFPAVLVDATTARRLGAASEPRIFVSAARPGQDVPQEELEAAVDRVATAATSSEGHELLTSVRGSYGSQATPWDAVAGDTPIQARRDGSLNDVPLFGHTLADATRPVAPIALLTLLVTLALVALLLGSTRAEDEVMALQGASGSLRAGVAATQAAVVSGIASLVGLGFGLLLVFIGLRTFNGINDASSMPDVPAIVPWIVPATLAALPFVAAVIAFVAVSFRRPPAPADLADRLDGLAW